MAPRFKYKIRTGICLLLAVLLSWVSYDNSETVPELLTFTCIGAVLLCIVGAFRFIQLDRYYEGPRTRIVVATSTGRIGAASRPSATGARLNTRIAAQRPDQT